MFKMDIYNILTSYFLFSKLFGVFPYSVDYNLYSKKFKISLIWCFQTTFVLLFQFLLFIRCYNVGLITNSVVLEVWRVITLVGILLNIIQFIFSILKIRKKIEFIQEINQLDKKALQIGIFMNSKGLRRKVLILIMISIGIMIVTVLLFTIPILIFTTFESPLFLVFMLNSSSMLFTIFNITQFTIFALVLKTRFLKLNRFLKFSLDIRKLGWKADNLNKFIELFSHACLSLQSFNHFFSTKIIFTLFYLIIHITFVISSMITMMYSEYFRHLKAYLMINVIGTFLLLIILLSICWSGHSVREAIDLSENLIVNQISNTQDEIFEKELKKLHYKYKNHKRDIENVFFKINMKLFSTVSII